MNISNFTILFLTIILSHSFAQAQTNGTQAEKNSRAEIFNNLGVVNAEAGRLAEAIELFSQAIALRPDYAAAYDNLGGTYYRAGRIAKSIDALNTAVRLNPFLAESYLRLGVIYSDSGRNNIAVDYLKQALKLRPNFAPAYHNLGSVYLRRQKFKAAVGAFERALSLDPKNIETYVQSGYALSRLKKYRQAIERMEEAVSRRPQDMEAQFFLGQLYLLNRDKESALSQYRKVAFPDAARGKNFISPYTVIYWLRRMVTNRETDVEKVSCAAKEIEAALDKMGYTH